MTGPEIRTGFLKQGKPIEIQRGQEITITTDYSIKGDENMISMSYNKLAHHLSPESNILCADGTISFTVLECDMENGLVRCRCENSAVLGERKNVNLPGVVENQEGVANFDEILANSDAFMVARGDLGMEIPIEKIFLAQKVMKHKSNIQGKPVVTATQMLESAIKSPRPTRAEATNVANTVLDGTDCVMLSGETAAGAYPDIAVQTMARICSEAESFIDSTDLFRRVIETAPTPMSPLESMLGLYCSNAALILVLTRGGTTSKLVAKYTPSMPILEETPLRHSLIYRGLIPVLGTGSYGDSMTKSTEETIELALSYAKKNDLCKTGDSVVALHRLESSTVIKILDKPHFSPYVFQEIFLAWNSLVLVTSIGCRSIHAAGFALTNPKLLGPYDKTKN
ncbi:Pyruvate kinase, cytosolic isozyme [Glycine soja]